MEEERKKDWRMMGRIADSQPGIITPSYLHHSVRPGMSCHFLPWKSPWITTRIECDGETVATDVGKNEFSVIIMPGRSGAQAPHLHVRRITPMSSFRPT